MRRPDCPIRKLIRCSGLAAIGLVLQFGSSAAHAVVINVPADQPTITQAVFNAGAGDEIVVAPGTYNESNIDLTGKDIVLRSSAGPASTIINAGGGGRIFVIDIGTPDTLRVEGFTLTGGSAAGGGAVFIGGCSPTFRNCVFTGNTTSASGGAAIISVGSFSGTSGAAAAPLFENCTFSGNISTATTGTTSRGGAVSVSGAWPTFRNCTFVGNTHNRTGGAVGITSNTLFVPAGGPPPVTFENCTFDGNISVPTSSTVGGGPCIHVNSRSIVMTDCIIRNHTSTSTIAVGAYGLVMAGAGPQTAPLTRTTFSNNFHSGGTAASRPIILMVTSGALTINGGGFTNNGFRLSDGAELGFNTGINLSPATGNSVAVTISNATFTGNSTSATTPVGNTALIFGRGDSAVGGGGLSTLSVTNTAFSANEISAVLFSGGAGSASFTGGSIASNIGGAGMIVANPIGSLSITGTSISGNSGLIGVSGAAAPATAGTFTLNNVALSANLDGSISASNFSTATITGGSLSNQNLFNTPINFVGAGSHSISGMSFTNNNIGTASSRNLVSFTQSGAAPAGSVAIINCTFTGNTATGSSSSILDASNFGSASVSGTTISGNVFSGAGATLLSFSDGTNVSITGTAISSNPATAIGITDVASSTVASSAFLANDDALFVSTASSGTLSVTGSDFLGNTGAGGGPTGINAGDGISATIVSCRFIGNADGGIGLGGGANTIQNTLIAGGTGTNNGAITLDGSSITSIINCTLTGNSSGGLGSGITLNSSASATVVNTISFGNLTGEIDASATVGTIDVSFSNIQGGFAGAGNIDLPPTFVDADGPDNAANTIDDNYRLAATSAGLNVGSNAAVPGTLTTDLGGSARIVGVVDIGAYEFQGTTCAADFDNNGTLEVADIFTFLNAWFAGLPSADFNAAGGVDINDIFDYLNAFFAGC